MKSKVKINDPFERKESMVTNSGHEVSRGDMFKVSGEHGSIFKFHSYVTNPKNGTTWVDCFEMQKGITGPSRSFYPDSVRPVTKRGKRVKRSSNS